MSGVPGASGTAEPEAQERRLTLRGFTHDDAWIDRKRCVVERYDESSLLVGSRFRAEGTTFDASSCLDPDRYAAHGGSFPLHVDGAGVIGTVSGLPQAEDHATVVEALTRLATP
ncbi:heme-binding protein [Streptomyces sp. SCSIO 30461]|uniref:heme-binding protein n=1 Tax=Streptomyces sp. SCSIO 30461 TaxID=3118085 RepID=UPI0030CE4C11